MEEVSAIKEIYKDFEYTIKDSQKLESKDLKTEFLKLIWQAILRFFAPLF